MGPELLVNVTDLAFEAIANVFLTTIETMKLTQWQFSAMNNFDSLREFVQSPYGKINVIMTLGGGGGSVLLHDVLQLHCQQISVLVVIMQSCG